MTIKAGKNLDREGRDERDVKAGVNATFEAQHARTLKGATTSVAGQTSFSMG